MRLHGMSRNGFLRGLHVLAGIMFVLLWLSPVLSGGATTAWARQGFAAIAVDARTGRVLFARNADARRLPASITKVMTAYMLFREIRRGRYRLSSRLMISRHAASMQPSKLGLKPGSTITVDQALRAILTKSANDIAVAIAENIAGSESRFARRMTRVARSMGMTRTTFRNASGLPRPKNVTTARDLATLALRIQRDFPGLYRRYFGLRYFRFRGRVHRNHNRLLGRVKGMDGLKTGYTRAAGYNLAASARRNGRRVVAVVLGAPTSRARNAYMARLIERMFRSGKLRRGTMIAAVAGTPPGWNGGKVRLANAARSVAVRAKAKSARARAGRDVHLPKPALAGLVRRVTAPVPKPRPDEIIRVATRMRRHDEVADRKKVASASGIRHDQGASSRPAGNRSVNEVTGSERIAAIDKVEGRIFVSVRPAPRPDGEAGTPSRDNGETATAGEGEAVKRKAPAGVVAMKVRPVSQPGAGDDRVVSIAGMESPAAVGRNETVIAKSDALLPVGAIVDARHSAGNAEMAVAGTVEATGKQEVRPSEPGKERRHDEGDGDADGALVTASVSSSEKKLEDAQETQDPGLERRLKSWNIQLGSFPARDGAKKRIDEALKKFRPLLRGKEGFTMVYRKGSRTYYRARFAGFNRRTALRACRMLKRRGIACFALAPAANRS